MGGDRSWGLLPETQWRLFMSKFRDCIGNTLEVGDQVAYSSYGGSYLLVGIIKGFTEQRIKVDDGSQKGTLKTGDYLAKVTKEVTSD